ncbi:MAG: hypothetical protein IT581_15195 [Verrucomicrobiales bacterium]|nr:hypothetical protein [Verrucomicrobiales bacterium]
MAALPAARDTSFQTLPMDGLPNASVLLPDGKILIGGNFQTIGGIPRPALARLNADGSLDTTFEPPVAGSGAFGRPFVSELVVQADGHILAAGSPSFRTTGIIRTNIIRFQSDGTVDASFDVHELQHFHGLAVQPDGRVIFALASITGFKPVRLLANGDLDPSFAYSGGYFPQLMPLQFAVQTDGHILGLAGDGDPSRIGNYQLYRLNADGSNDAAFKFPSPPNNLVDESRFAIGADGQVLVSVYDGTPAVTRLAPDGARDAAFTWVGDPNAQRLYPVAAAFLPDGGAIAVRQPTAGDRRLSFFYLTSSGRLAGSRDLPNSAVDNGVVGIGTIAARAFAVQPDSRLLFAAGFQDGFQNTFGMFRLPPPPVAAPPVITQQPATSTALGAGDTLSLAVTGTSDSPITYRWYHSQTNLPGQTSAFLNIFGGSPERAGEFYVVLQNAFGNTTSQVATVTVRDPAPPTILTQPQGGTTRLSQNFSFSAQCQSEVTVGFQWYKNGVPFIGNGSAGQTANFASLFLPANDANRAGDYLVIFTNTFGGAVTSTVAHLDLILPGPPTITAQPSDLALFATQPVQLSVAAMADGNLIYRWLRDGVNLVPSSDIPTVSGPNLYVNARKADRFGGYSVVVSLTTGESTTSRVAQVTLLPSGPPLLLSQSTSQIVPLGARTNFIVAFNGEAPVTVTWLHAGTNVLTQTYNQVDGPTTNDLTVLGIPNGAGDYQCVVSNRLGATRGTTISLALTLPPSSEFHKDLADTTVGIGEYNTVSLRNGLVITNCCGNIETAHVLAFTPGSGTPTLGSGEPWYLGVGISNRFYVGAQGGFATQSGSWNYVPGALDFTGLVLTNFPASGKNSRLETFDNGTYSIGLVDSIEFQSGTFRVLGPRRPATNVLSVDILSSNTVDVAWYHDGAPLDFSRGSNASILTESLGNPPVAGGINTRYKLILSDVKTSDAGRYWVQVGNYVKNPDTSFGQPSSLLYATVTSRVATLTVHGYAAGEAPGITAASRQGGLTSMDEPTALALSSDHSSFVATRMITFGGSSSSKSVLSLHNPAGETLRSAEQRSEQLNGGDVGVVRAIVSDGDGGAIIAGDGASGTTDPWFLRRVRPATVVSGSNTNQTFTNLWTTRVAGPFPDDFQNLITPHAADVMGLVRAADGVIVAGHFQGRPRFGSILVITNPALPFFSTRVGGVTLTNAFDTTFGRYDGSKDVFVAKYNWDGALLWARSYGGTNSETLATLTTDSAGNLYLAGSFKTQTTFGNLAIESTKVVFSPNNAAYATDGFVAKLNSAGDPVWVRNFGGLYGSSFNETVVTSAAADSNGGVFFLANRVASTAVLRPGMVVGSHYLARLNAEGDLLWSQDFTGLGNGRLALDPAGNAILAENIVAANGTTGATLGAATFYPPSFTGMAAAKFAPGGSLLWFRALDRRLGFVDDPMSPTAQHVAVDSDGSVVVAAKVPGGTQGNQGRTAGLQLDDFEFTSTTPATANPTDVLLVRLASEYVPAAPRLTLAPLSQTGLLQDRVVLEGRATSQPAPSYQWLFNGKPIVGATNRVLAFAELSRTNAGSYSLVASNALGVTISDPVTLTAQIRPNMSGWTLVTSATNFLGNPYRVAADDAGNFYLLHIETARGGFMNLEAFRPDGTFAWRFRETTAGVFPVQDYQYHIEPRFAPVVTPSGALFIAGRYQINRLQGAGSINRFLARVNPVDGTVLWAVNDLALGTVSIVALDIDDQGNSRVALSDRTVRRFDADGHELPGTTLAHLPSTTDPLNSRVAFDPTGGFYVYANRVEALALGNTNLPALGANPGAQNLVLARYDATGALLWSRTFTGPGTGVIDPFRVFVTSSGDALVAGSFGVGNQANLKFQVGTNLLAGYGYAARISSAGDVAWAKSWLLHIDDAARATDDSVVLTGWLRTSAPGSAGDRRVAFGTNLVGAAYLYDTFVAAVDGSGNERYIRHTGSPNFATYDNARDYAVAVNSHGTLWTAGFSVLPPAAASLDFGNLHYEWPDLRPYNIGNLFGDLPTFYVARLDLEATPPETAEITWTHPAANSTTLRLSWPTGYRLQHRASLYSGEWTTLDVQPPFDADLRSTLEGYFRVVRVP